MSFKFILGVLNSRLLNAYYRAKSLTNKKSIAQVKKLDLNKLPIRVVNLSDATQRSQHENMVMRVDAILDAKKKLAQAITDKDTTYYRNKCAALERQIDRLVYDLYGLTAEEVTFIEAETPS